LENIIENLPKTNDLIENIKSKINKEFELIEKKLKELKLLEANITFELKFDSKNVERIKDINNLITSNIKILNQITLTNKKIQELKNNIGQIKTNKNFNTQWIGGKVPGELIDTDDGYRIRFDGKSRSFTPFEI